MVAGALWEDAMATQDPSDDTLTADEYDDEAERYVNAYFDGHNGSEPLTRQGVIDGVADDVAYHEWFARGDRGMAFYGAVLDHARTNATAEYTDWEVACDASSPEAVVKRLALFAFQNDVIERALHHAELIGPDAARGNQ